LKGLVVVVIEVAIRINGIGSRKLIPIFAKTDIKVWIDVARGTFNMKFRKIAK
jgi:hypothetical protein